jgi:hypothetical protein
VTAPQTFNLDPKQRIRFERGIQQINRSIAKARGQAGICKGWKMIPMGEGAGRDDVSSEDD